MEYRIEITTRKNGKKQYAPQVYIGNVRSGIFVSWENIITTPSTSSYETSSSMKERWDSEEEAMKVIEGHREKTNIENENQIESVTYKEVEYRKVPPSPPKDRILKEGESPEPSKNYRL